MLDAQVATAVNQIKVALGSLVIDIELVKRVKTGYVPGSPISYTLATTTEKAVISAFTLKQHTDLQIPKTDLKILFFPNSAVPEINDLLNINSQEYQIISVKSTYAGSRIVLYNLQVRPNGL